MDADKSMAGWIGFAGIVMLVIGGIDLFQGLIAVLKDDYYVVSRSGFLAVDLTAWGWALMIWGALLVIAGLGLDRRARMGALGNDRTRRGQRVRPAGIPGKQPIPTVGADRAHTQRDRPVRAHSTLERKQRSPGDVPLATAAGSPC